MYLKRNHTRLGTSKFERDYGLLIKEGRLNLGLTQVEVATMAGVSLPTVQNIESGKGNPSVEVLSAILNAIGLELEVKSLSPDWDMLARCGLPLSSKNYRKINPNPNLLLRNLLLACLYLETNKNDPERERKTECVEALLLAIRTYFPTFYVKHMRGKIFDSYLPTRITDRHIKLKRIAGDILATYL